MRKRWAAALLAVCLCATLSGCSFAVLDAKNLMAPPKANEDQQAIHKLLQGSRQDITFIYPKSGTYRSAIIMEDFTGDGQKDAIGFYSLEDSGGVEVQFLTKSEGQWRTVAAFENTALQVDRVCFGSLTDSGSPSVLIGWGSTAGATGRTASVAAYICGENGDVIEYPLGFYGEMTLTDLNGDGVSEVFTVDKFLPAEVEGDEPTPAKARVFAWQNGAMKELWSTDADNSVSTYSQAVFGSLSSSLQGVVLDGAQADGSLTTQIFYLRDNALVNFPADINTEGYVNPFARPFAASFLSRDIDGDGCLEMPKASLLPGLSEDVAPDSTSYQVEWCGFREYSGVRTGIKALMNSTEGYWFQVPYLLDGRITASNDAARRTVTYTCVTESSETGDQLLSSPLFAIRAFTRSSWESRGESSGYLLLAAQNDTVYGMQILTADEDLLRNIHWIRRDFQLLSE